MSLIPLLLIRCWLLFTPELILLLLSLGTILSFKRCCFVNGDDDEKDDKYDESVGALEVASAVEPSIRQSSGLKQHGMMAFDPS